MSATAPPSLKIYVIDDDPDHVFIIGRTIQQVAPGTAVRSLNDGPTALASLEEEKDLPDLILLDINMAGENGFEVLSRLKSSARFQPIPVVMLTSSELSSDVARAYELGASGYISKPNRLLDLRAVLGNTLLYWSAMRRTTGRASSP